MVKQASFEQRRWQGIVAGAIAILLALGLAAPAWATSASELPALNADEATQVVDNADVLSRSTEGRLNRQLSQLAEDTGTEVRLVAIRRLDYGETIDSFADQLFSRWFPTPEASAPQVLLVLDTLTNSSAIRTGEAIPAALTAEIATSVAQDTLLYPIREDGKYNQAFLDASDRLAIVLSGQPDPGAPKIASLDIEATFTTAEETNSKSAGIWVIVLLVVATVVPMATYFAYVGFGD
ncbi:MAG: YgcG family protein [Spirulinaceae cyanobacterium RM2_2_10]|nr:YgcG family protein [Spirulinaceae cyanobacterium SM2_1_0]NJO21014.1 YgcG family protein [Spirulinaceae cyanobacterium RM2_2_10]